MKKLLSVALALAMMMAMAPFMPFMPAAQAAPPAGSIIQDPNFYAAVLALIGKPDGYAITPTDVSGITELWVDSKQINSLAGIEYFTALTILNCDFNQLAALDVTKNTALAHLYCGGNQLTALDVSKNTALTTLWCSLNQLTALDISKYTALTTLYCGGNQLTALDVSKNTALISLSCGNNQLTALDVTNNTALTTLHCANNQLTALDVSKNTALTELQCNYNQLTALDVSQNTALEILFCYDNQLTALDVSQNTALEILFCYDNQLTALDVSQNTALTRLWCYNNSMGSNPDISVPDWQTYWQAAEPRPDSDIKHKTFYYYPQNDSPGPPLPASNRRYTVLALDVSGSMSGTPLAKLKEAAIAFCRAMLDADGENHIAVVTYNSTGNTGCALTGDLNALTSAIEGMNAAGATNPGEGLALADGLLSKIAGEAVKNIVLMSDGLPTAGPRANTGRYTAADYTGYGHANDVYNTADMLKRKGYNVYTLGFFHKQMQRDEFMVRKNLRFGIRFMNDLQNRGAYIVQNPDDLVFAFGELGRQMTDPPPPKTVVRIECPVDFTITHKGETLSSDADIDSINLLTAWGKTEFSGPDLDKKTVTLYTDEILDLRMNGTDAGALDYAIAFYDALGNSANAYSLKNLAVTDKTLITAKTDRDSPAALLYDRYGDGNAETIMVPKVGAPLHNNMSAWAKPDLQKANDLGLIPDSLRDAGVDFTKPITRVQFAGVVVKAYENMSNTAALPALSNPFTDTRDIDALKAYNAGLMVGGLNPALFDPGTLLTRESCATGLTRAFKRAAFPGWTYETDADFPLVFDRPAPFADDADISAWAKDSVYFMAASGIIGGQGNNLFAPRAVTSDQQAIGYAVMTIESALIMAMRMVEKLK